MKYFALALVIFVCALAYIHVEQPALWNAGLAALKVSDGTNEAPEAVSAPPETNAAPSVPTNALPPTPLRGEAEIISPASAVINPDHVKTVMQPGETNMPSTNAPATNGVPSAP